MTLHAVAQDRAVRPDRQRRVEASAAEREIVRRGVSAIVSGQTAPAEDFHALAEYAENAARAFQTAFPLDLDRQFQIGHAGPEQFGNSSVDLGMEPARQPEPPELERRLDASHRAQQPGPVAGLLRGEDFFVAEVFAHRNRVGFQQQFRGREIPRSRRRSLISSGLRIYRTFSPFRPTGPTDEKERFALVGDICHAGEYASADVVQVDVRGYEQRVGLLSGRALPARSSSVFPVRSSVRYHTWRSDLAGGCPDPKNGFFEETLSGMA